MSGKKGMKHYTQETKLLVIQMFFEQGKSRREIVEELGLPGEELVKKWVRRYRKEGIQGFQKSIGRPRKFPQSPQAYVAQLEMENALLKKFHSELRKAMLARRNIGLSNTTEESFQ